MKYIDIDTDNDNQWQNSLNKYREYLNTIKYRFSKKFFTFYTSVGMHDSILTELKIIKRHLSNRTVIDIETTWERFGTVYYLTFKNSKKYITKLDLTEGYSEIGDFIVGEFLEVDKKFLSFEFLFYNDSSIYIEFEKLFFKIK